MITPKLKSLVKQFFKKEPKTLEDFIYCMKKIDKSELSLKSKRKRARTLLIYAQHVLSQEEFKFVKRKLQEKYNIKPRF